MVKVIEQNLITGETVEREQTTAEKEQAAKDKTEAQALIEAAEAKVAARQAVLDKLGLTSDEAAALLG
jgi:uncharacterized membrane protein